MGADPTYFTVNSVRRQPLTVAVDQRSNIRSKLFALSNPSSIYHGLIDFPASCTLSISQSTFDLIVVNAQYHYFCAVCIYFIEYS